MIYIVQKYRSCSWHRNSRKTNRPTQTPKMYFLYHKSIDLIIYQYGIFTGCRSHTTCRCYRDIWEPADTTSGDKAVLVPSAVPYTAVSGFCRCWRPQWVVLQKLYSNLIRFSVLCIVVSCWCVSKDGMWAAGLAGRVLVAQCFRMYEGLLFSISLMVSCKGTQ